MCPSRFVVWGSINNCDLLVVIDGVPHRLGLVFLNMADVERLDVLKDVQPQLFTVLGSQWSWDDYHQTRYGGKRKLAVSANYSFQNAARTHFLLNAAQHAELSNDMMVNSGRNLIRNGQSFWNWVQVPTGWMNCSVQV